MLSYAVVLIAYLTETPEGRGIGDACLRGQHQPLTSESPPWDGGVSTAGTVDPPLASECPSIHPSIHPPACHSARCASSENTDLW